MPLQVVRDGVLHWFSVTTTSPIFIFNSSEIAALSSRAMIARSLLGRCIVTQARTQYKAGFAGFYRLGSPGFFTPGFFTHTRASSGRQRQKPPFAPSHEQLEVVRLCSSQNVLVSARPGSGKTATAEAIVAAYPDKRVTVLTYSKRLQLETQKRLCNYTNCDVCTFHGMARLLFNVTMNNDTRLWEQRREVSRLNKLPQWAYMPFDIIVLDEFQDCTEIIYWLVNCFILANERNLGDQHARLVVLGDERQSIYRFRGADDRYLTLAPELFTAISPYPFAEILLGQSFRLSDQTVQFVNRVFLGGESCITSSKPGPKPIMLRCNPWNRYALASQLSTLIEQHGAKNSAILAPSVRNNIPLRDVVNTLAKEYRVPIAVPLDEEAPLDDRVINGKLCVSSIHQFKGSERDLVIVFGMDSSFFNIFGRTLPGDRCPNEVFVALTRAAKQLVVVHDESKKLMPFVDRDALYKTAEVVNMTEIETKIAPPKAPGRTSETRLTLPLTSSIRDMTRHIRDESLDGIVKRDLCIRQLSSPLPKEEHIDMQNVVPSDRKKGFHEAVSDINGLVVVAAFEYEFAGTLSTLDLDPSSIVAIPPTCLEQRISWLCRHACEYEANVSGYQPRVIQMKNHRFDWIEPKDLDLARNRLQGELGDLPGNLRFEVQVKQDFIIDNQTTWIHGRADIVHYATPDGNDGGGARTIWEIKFVSQLSNEHICQACMYAYLLDPQTRELPRIIIYNVRDGEKIEIAPRDGREGLRRMIEDILRLKWTALREKTHEEFIEEGAEILNEVLSKGDSGC
ncbi:hypothetical protein O1611_g5094 [Lasiodiplodia mahajangana]|uniref:Uncharacterized protein n=1 Tax=Lasiodiplodia mahajangana TaxID=1108764 RepID=A0ACC2JM15_9PEZI|nr:hypothetical protein O1611_g5094 [Lasiodiplodia mahajangana]